MVIRSYLYSSVLLCMMLLLVPQSQGQDLSLYQHEPGKLVPVANLIGGEFSSSPRNFTVGADYLFFTANTSTIYAGPGTFVDVYSIAWFDGKEVKHEPMFPTTSLSLSSIAKDFTAVGNLLYFSATTQANGWELYSYNPKNKKLTLLETRTGGGNGDPEPIVSHNGFLFFSSRDDNGRRQLYRTNGSTVTKLTNYSVTNTDFHQYTHHSGNLLFLIREGSTAVVYRVNEGSTALVQRNVVENGGWPTHGIFSVGSRVCLVADTLWDRRIFRAPANQTPVLVSTISFLNTSILGSVGGYLLFRAPHGSAGDELWRTDCTVDGTELLKDINPGASGSNPASFGRVNNKIVFLATTAANGRELWVTDGTSAGTKILVDLIPGAGSPTFYVSGPQHHTDNYLFVSAQGDYDFVTDGTNVTELWFSATSAAEFKDQVLVSADAPPYGHELFRIEPKQPLVVYAPWEGFLNISSIYEIRNAHASQKLNVTATLYDIQGKPGKTLKFSLNPRAQRDLIANDMDRFSKNSYGLVKFTFSHALWDATTSYYQFKRDGSVAFSYSLPLSGGLTGDSFASYNTYFPGSIKPGGVKATHAWLSIINLDPKRIQRYTIYKYNSSGKLLSQEEASAPPLGRRDVEAGHVNPGPNTVGLMRIVPKDSTVPYVAILKRFGVDVPSGGVQWAHAFQTESAEMLERSVVITNRPGANQWVEIVNLSNQTRQVQLHVDSPFLYEKVSIRARSQHHIFVPSLVGTGKSAKLDISEVRDFVVGKEATNQMPALLAQTMTYHTNSKGEVIAVDGYSAGKTSSSNNLRDSFPVLLGSYNRFLGMRNYLRITTNTFTSQNIVVALYRGNQNIYSQTYNVGRSAVLELPLHDSSKFKTKTDTYGTIAILGLSDPHAVTATIERVHPNGHFSATSELR